MHWSKIMLGRKEIDADELQKKNRASLNSVAHTRARVLASSCCSELGRLYGPPRSSSLGDDT